MNVEPTPIPVSKSEEHAATAKIQKARKANIATNIFVIISLVLIATYVLLTMMGWSNTVISLLTLPPMLIMIFYLLPLAIEGIVRLFRILRLIRQNILFQNDALPADTQYIEKISSNYIWIHFMLAIHFVSAMGILALSYSPSSDENNLFGIFLIIASTGPAQLSVLFSILAIIMLRKAGKRLSSTLVGDWALQLEDNTKKIQIIAWLNIILSGIVSSFLIFA